jgi:hypothetical protein
LNGFVAEIGTDSYPINLDVSNFATKPFRAVISAQSRIVPSHLVGVCDQIAHGLAGGISGNCPIEAMITEGIDGGIPIAIVMELSAHEEHGSARALPPGQIHLK